MPEERPDSGKSKKSVRFSEVQSPTALTRKIEEGIASPRSVAFKSGKSFKKKEDEIKEEAEGEEEDFGAAAAA